MDSSYSSDDGRTDSIVIKRDAKGAYAYEAKVYFNSKDQTDAERAWAHLQSVDVKFKAAFPV